MEGHKGGVRKVTSCKDTSETEYLALRKEEILNLAKKYDEMFIHI